LLPLVAGVLTVLAVGLAVIAQDFLLQRLSHTQSRSALEATTLTVATRQ
jgi:hypothetical protein